MALLFLHIRFLDVLDIVLVASLLYALYNLLRGTGAINILFGLVSIYLLWRIVKALDMLLLSEILGAFIGVGMVALLVVFQPEIRKFLLLLGKQPRSLTDRSRRHWFPFGQRFSNDDNLNSEMVVKACDKFSKEFIGALIVFARTNDLRDYVETGTRIQALLSKELIGNIFFKNSPLHDGAVIISHDRIEAAGCILPVSDNPHIDSSLGLRHRAAIGLSERTDALCIVVSEETGFISYVDDGEVTRDISPAELQNLLSQAFYNEKKEK